MNATGKLIFALVITVNLAAIATVVGMNKHSHTSRDAQVVQLGEIVVTPANVEPETIQLGAVVVTPTEDDWRFAEAYGVNRPAAAETLDSNLQDATADSLLQALTAFSPGQYLDSYATLRALEALAFQSPGR